MKPKKRKDEFKSQMQCCLSHTLIHLITSVSCRIKVRLFHLLLTSVNVEYSVSSKPPRIVFHLMKHAFNCLNVVYRIHHYSCSTGDL